jgi:hypothetical protein
LHGLPIFSLDPTQAAETRRVVKVLRIEKAHSGALPLQYPDCELFNANHMSREEAITNNLVFWLEATPDRDAHRSNLPLRPF